MASGASRARVSLSIYRRALPTPIVVLGTVFGSLLGGVVLLETLFNIQGLGRYAVQAAGRTDLPLCRGCCLCRPPPR